MAQGFNCRVIRAWKWGRIFRSSTCYVCFLFLCLYLLFIHLFIYRRVHGNLGTSTVEGSEVIEPEEWHHLVFRFDAQSKWMKCFLLTRIVFVYAVLCTCLIFKYREMFLKSSCCLLLLRRLVANKGEREAWARSASDWWEAQGTAGRRKKRGACFLRSAFLFAQIYFGWETSGYELGSVANWSMSLAYFHALMASLSSATRRKAIHL